MSTIKKILAFGATSAICHEALKHYASEDAEFYLAARSEDKLNAIADDLTSRGGTVSACTAYDFNDWQRHEAVVNEAATALGHVDLVLVAHGSLPQQAECESSNEAVWSCMQDNFTSAAVIIHACARLFENQGSGNLAVISSVAGDRGRKSNYTYGAAKAGLDALLQGLQGRFAGTGIKVINIKPGMIKTPMTAGMEGGPLWSTPQAIAPGIVRAIETGKRVCYLPGYWRVIMLVIRLLPTSILAKLPI